MTKQQHVAVYRAYWEHLGEQRYDEAFALLHDDFSNWFGLAEALPGLTNPQNKSEYVRFLTHQEETPFPNGIKVSVNTIWASEGDNLATENTSFGISRNGNEYRNVYATLVTFKDGKILRIHEYTDTLYGTRIVSL